jgi:hypothetical protein
MPTLPDPFLQLTAGAFVFLLTELSVLLVVQHEGDYGWKWRFGEAEDYPELNPFVNTWKIALFFFIAIIVAPVVVSYFVWNSLLSMIGSFAFWPLLLVVSILFSFWWIWHHIVGKEFDARQYCLLAASAILTLVFVYLNMRG